MVMLTVTSTCSWEISKSKFCRIFFFLALNNDQASLIIHFALRNRSDNEEMKSLRNYVCKSSYVSRKDRKDSVGVLCTTKKLHIIYFSNLGFVIQIVMPEKTRFTENDKDENNIHTIYPGH